MRNLLDERDRQGLFDRFDRISSESRRLWGRMDVRQMVCHVADPMRIALGEIDAKDASNVFTRTVLRWMVLAGVPAPKGKVETFAEIDQAKGGGTQPTQLAADIATLRDVTTRFVAHAAAGRGFVRSPAFGELSSSAYGRLMYVHMDHHLGQFGV